MNSCNKRLRVFKRLVDSRGVLAPHFGAAPGGLFGLRFGAKVVRHGRYVKFQVAEVAIPRRLFAEILQLIDGLRPKPAPT